MCVCAMDLDTCKRTLFPSVLSVLVSLMVPVGVGLVYLFFVIIPYLVVMLVQDKTVTPAGDTPGRRSC